MADSLLDIIRVDQITLQSGAPISCTRLLAGHLGMRTQAEDKGFKVHPLLQSDGARGQRGVGRHNLGPEGPVRV